MPARELPHEPWALPVVPDPAPGESWSSYFTRTAALNDTTVCILENATGIRAEDTLSPHDIPAAAALVNLEPSQVHVMTLERWTGIAYRESPHLTRTSKAHRWTWNKTRYACPSCQHTGVTLLEWRLPWITTCPLHERYLTTSPAASPMTQAITQTLLFRDALQRETCDFSTYGEMPSGSHNIYVECLSGPNPPTRPRPGQKHSSPRPHSPRRDIPKTAPHSSAHG